MICWNKSAQDNLYNIFNKIKDDSLDINFFILSWASNIWKTTLVKNNVKRILSEYYYSDFLYIKDYSDYLWKNHIIRVDNSKNPYIDIPSLWNIYDYWARQIIDWLSKTPTWKYKVLLIENIDRMNINAANAFLKTFEEAPSNVYIFATTSNKNILLETILSRAFLIKFEIPEFDVIRDCVYDSYPEFQKDDIDDAIYFSSWRIWYAIKLLKWENNLSVSFSEIRDKFYSLLDLLQSNWKYNQKLKDISYFREIWIFELFLDALWYNFYNKWYYLIINDIISLREKLRYNVGFENAVFEFILNIENIDVKKNI